MGCTLTVALPLFMCHTSQPQSWVGCQYGPGLEVAWQKKKKKASMLCARRGLFQFSSGGGERGTGVSGPLTFFSVVLFMTESDSFGTKKRILRFCALFFFLLSFYCELCVCKLTHDVISYFRVRECHFSFWWAFLSDMNVPFKRCCKLSLFRPACILCLVCFYCPFAGCSALLSRLKVWWETCKTGLDAVSEILEQPSGVYNILYKWVRLSLFSKVEDVEVLWFLG